MTRTLAQIIVANPQHRVLLPIGGTVPSILLDELKETLELAKALATRCIEVHPPCGDGYMRDVILGLEDDLSNVRGYLADLPPEEF